MKRATLSIVSVAILSLSFLSCQSLLNIENPDYSIQRVTPRVAMAFPLSNSSIDFDFTIAVDNPNSVALNLDQIDFDLYVNNNMVVRGVSNEQVRVPANGFGQVQLTTRVDYDSIRTLFREIADIVQGESANYELRGKAYYRTPLGRVGFPFRIYD